MLLPDAPDSVVPAWLLVVEAVCPLDVGPVKLWVDRVEVLVVIPF